MQTLEESGVSYNYIIRIRENEVSSSPKMIGVTQSEFAEIVHKASNGIIRGITFYLKGSISNCLTFFETIYILKNRRVISFEIVDDLFAYRFFLAVHSDLFQKNKLGSQPENFRNIYKLEKEWLDYRVSIGKNSQKELDEACQRFAKMDAEQRRTAKWNNVYEARQLRGLVDEDRYEKLVQ